MPRRHITLSYASMGSTYCAIHDYPESSSPVKTESQNLGMQHVGRDLRLQQNTNSTLGTKVIIHEKPQQRKIWDPHGTKAGI
jgi:hypothetical protein